MPILWQILKPEDKMKLGKLYRKLAGFEFIPPDSPRQTIQCETKIESLEEIDKIMRKVPGSKI